MSYKCLISIGSRFTFFFRSSATRWRNIVASFLCGILAAMITYPSSADIFGAIQSNNFNTRMTYRSMLKKCGYTEEQLNSMTHLSNKEMEALIMQNCQRGNAQEQSMPSGSTSCESKCGDFYIQCSIAGQTDNYCSQQTRSCIAACR